ncbi:MAG: hypothetical protein LKE33_02425 [Acidaminococcus sp.]|nr:hypothetical protein [Acidaminococcus sp.]MCI2101080.1 hypothetical protein [Acidaminococcus sp.]MCI2115489.1 hypothetical protein [Acidaminococcus sp.]MCI2117611.1 hypothetical protein [Acidaminococcus sp.]
MHGGITVLKMLVLPIAVVTMTIVTIAVGLKEGKLPASPSVQEGARQ